MKQATFGIVALVLLAAAVLSGQEMIRKEMEKLQGTWAFETYEESGVKTAADELKNKRIFFGANQLMIKIGDEVMQLGALKLAPLDGHRDFDATVAAGPNKGNTMRCIYSLKGDILKVCIDPEGNERPTEFKTTADSGLALAVYKRIIPAGEEIDITGNYKAESVQ